MDRLGIFCFFILLLSCRQSTHPVDIKTNLIQLQIVDNNQGGHNDILFQISGLTNEKAFDSYFFILAMERNKNVDKLDFGVAGLFEYWKEKTLLMADNNTIFLPIDFSDEYTGCIKVEKVDMSLILTYGFSRIMGLNVNPLDPENFYKEVKDFEADNDKHLTIRQEDLINSLDIIIHELKNAR
jgi:hypothetical protein